MTFDSLRALREAGHPVDLISEEQQMVLRTLTAEEVTVLNSLKEKFDVVAGEVEAQELKLL